MNSTSDDVLDALQDWFIERLGQPVNVDALYLKEEGLDSFDAIAFVAFVEKTFSLRLDAKDLQSPKFATLRGAVEIIKARRG